jgi:glycerol-3-phosphate dehydrogenase
MNLEPDFDLAVIGAGINGAGIARDAALRGLSVVVLEQNDLCSGTSAASSRLIHGGLRYLEYGEIPLVYESLHERRYLRQIAAHLVEPLRIAIPIYRKAKRGPLLIRLGMMAYDLLSLGKRMPRCRIRIWVCWLYSTSVSAQPSRPARAVRPDRWR